MLIRWRERSANLLRRFSRDGSGAIAVWAVIFLSFLLLPAIGAGVDIARAFTSRNRLQDALDATGLALAHLPSNTPLATLQKDANAWLAADLHDSNISNLQLNVTPSANTLQLSASASVGTLLSGLAGIKQIPVTANSTVKWGINRIEVALVLDNTGSMNSNNKIQTLISSANTLVTTLFSQNGGGTAVKVAVVPFTMTVNVGSQYQSANWLTGTLPSAYGTDIFNSATNRFTLFNKLGVGWGGCVESRPAPYDVQETAPNQNDPATMFVPFFAPDEPGAQYGVSYYAGGYFYNDYLPDGISSSSWQTLQGNPAKYSSAQPLSGTSLDGYIFGPNAGCQIAPLLRLTASESAVHNEINQMVAVGDTNLAMGLMWGWHVLSPYAPFADGVAYGTPNVNKVIVFLTDGWNDESIAANADGSYYSGIGYIWQNRVPGLTAGLTQAQIQAAMDARTALVCSNIRSKGITVYTVRIDVTSQSPAVLQNCASSPDKFFDVPNVQNLPAAFANIAGSIGSLRLSQ